MFHTILALAALCVGPDPNLYVADTGSPAGNRSALEAVIAKARQGPGTRPIVIPHGFTVDRPVNGFGVEMCYRGDRPGAVFSCSRQSPPLYLGLMDSPAPFDGLLPQVARPFSPEHIVDSFGKVDATLAPAPGAWKGLATFGADTLPDTVYAWPSSPFQMPGGKSWEEQGPVTVDVIYEARPETPIGYQVFGSEQAGKPWPLYASTWEPADHSLPPVHQVWFQTTDGVVREFNVPMPDAQATVRRLSFTLDPGAGRVAAWAGGKAVDCVLTSIGEGWGPNLALVDVGQATWKHGGLGDPIDAWQDSFGGRAKYVFHGNRISAGWRYDKDSDGNQVTVSTGKITTDRDRVAGEDGSLLARTWNEKFDPSTRWQLWLTARPNSAAGHGIGLLGASHTHPYNTSCSATMADLDMRSGTADAPELAPYGAGIGVGGTIQGKGFRFERMRFAGGMDGYKGYNAGATYPVLWRDIAVRGGIGDGLTCRMTTGHFEGLFNIEYAARNGVVSTISNLDVANCLITEASPKCRTYFHMVRGGRLRIGNVTGDTEFNPAPTVAMILAEANVWGDFPGTRLEIGNSTLDGGAQGAPLALLKDMGPPMAGNNFPASVELRGVAQWHPERGPTFQTDGGRWQGVCSGFLGKLPASRKHVDRWGPPGPIDGTVEYAEPTP